MHVHFEFSSDHILSPGTGASSDRRHQVAPGTEGSPADAWNTGRANDLIDDGTGLSFTVASENGGIWRVAVGAQAVPVSNTWAKAHLRSLAVGPDRYDNTHLYEGGEGLFETDLSAAFQSSPGTRSLRSSKFPNPA